jgi:CHAT domain-containing protein/Tfp pilus assembly protein PilF
MGDASMIHNAARNTLSFLALFVLVSTSLPALRADDQAELAAAFTQAEQLRDAAKYAQAAPLYEKALSIALRLYGEQHADTATILNSTAILHLAQGQYASAEQFYQRSLKIREKVFPKNHPHVAHSLNNLADLYRILGQYTLAEEFCRRSLELREANYGLDHADVAQSVHNLAVIYQAQGRHAEAEPLYQRGLSIRETVFGENHSAVADSLNDLANLYASQVKYGQAEQLYQRSRDIYEQVFGQDHPAVAQPLNNLAILYCFQGKYAQAEPLYQRCLTIYETAQGKSHPDVANALNNLAMLYKAQGKFAAAEAMYQRSLRIREAALGTNHPYYAQSLSNLGNLYAQQEKYAEAEPLHRRSLEIREAVHGKDHISVADSLGGLANLYLAQGMLDEADPLYQRSLQTFKNVLGKNHPIVAHTLQGQAMVAILRDQFEQGESLLQSAIEILRARLGKDHPDTAGAVDRLAGLYARQGRHADSIRMYERALRSLHRHAKTVLPALAEREQLDYLELYFASSLRKGLTLALTASVGEENRLRMASWLLNGKAVAMESLSERLILARDNASEKASQTLSELEDVRRQLAQATLGNANSDSGQLEELARREKRLESLLHGFDTRTHRDDPWFEIDELRQKLPASGVLIDITRFEPTNFQAKTSESEKLPARYVAFLTTRLGDVQIVELGLAEPIEQAIQSAREELSAATTRINDKGELEAEQELRQSLAALAALVLHPLLPQIEKAEQWFISPDSNLWLVPWGALPLKDGRFAIEGHRIQFLVSGRDLILNPLQLDRKPTPPLVLADPDFDLNVPAQPPSGTETRSLLGGLALGAIRRLPGTATEAEALAPKLERFAGAVPQVFTDDQALTGVFRSARAPRVVVLATHGFFLPDRDTKVENPLLRCGVLLAGCNRAPIAKVGEDIGVLTGLEIVGVDLRGTELVVLSACETGLGDVRNGEGVAGLRQAFQLAGAETVVASLWQVPDRATALLMVAFFEQLAAGKSKADAMREAQLEMIQASRKRSGAAHPYFWAAFTVTGR